MNSFFQKPIRKPSKNYFLEDYQKLQDQLASIKEVSNNIVGFLDLDKVLDLVLRRLVKNLGLIFSGVLLFSEDNRFLYYKKVSISKRLMTLIERSLGFSVYDIKLYTDKKIYLKNLQTRTALEGSIQTSSSLYDFTAPFISKTANSVIQKSIGIKFLIAVPLKVKGNTIGTIAGVSKRTTISQDEKDLWLTFANQISIAIYNARLFEQVQGQVKTLDAQKNDLKALFDTARTTSKTLDFHKVAQEIVDSIPQKLDHLGYLGGVLTLVDWEKRANTAFAITQTPIVKKALKLLKGSFQSHIGYLDITRNLTSNAILNKKMYSSNTYADIISPVVPKAAATAIQRIVGMKSATVVPIIVRDHVIGTLSFIRKRTIEQITNRDKDIMRTFASQVGIAMENARLHENLKKKVEELKELNKLKSQFLADTSHELKTPLTAIKGNAEVMSLIDQRRTMQSSKELELIKISTDRMAKVVSQLLTLTKSDIGQLQLDFKRCDISKLVQSEVDQMNIIALKKDVVLKMETNVSKKNNSLFISADKDRLGEVFQNLLSNAIKYTPSGGMITIGIKKTRSRIRVSVKDTGIGIPNKDLPNIFERFYRVDKARDRNLGGTGLGLAICKTIVKAHRGSISAKSNLGEGSIFVVELPFENRRP